MFRAIGAFVAALLIAAPGAAGSQPRSGILDEPRSHVILDIFDSEKVGFGFTDAWEEWTPPEGVDYAVFELFGGEGESGEARGHVAAGIKLEPDETYLIRVGGGGEHTAAFSSRCAIPEWWECDGAVIAAGGDLPTSWYPTNLVPPEATRLFEVWEGGGPDSERKVGWALIHYWPPASGGSSGGEPPLADPPPGPVGNMAAGDPQPTRLVPRVCRKGGKAPIRTASVRVGLSRNRAVQPRQRRTCISDARLIGAVRGKSLGA